MNFIISKYGTIFLLFNSAINEAKPTTKGYFTNWSLIESMTLVIN